MKTLRTVWLAVVFKSLQGMKLICLDLFVLKLFPFSTTGWRLLKMLLTSTIHIERCY